MNNVYSIDLSLRPTTFDLWHVCLAATVVLLAFILIAVLLSVLIGHRRCSRKAEQARQQMVENEPETRVVEKIVEVPVEKIVEKVVEVPGPAPEPVVLKEATPEAALQLLGMLQKEARFIDFIHEDVSQYGDADVGVAARVVHEGCKKVIDEHFSLATIRQETEGSKVTLAEGFNSAEIRLTGNIVGQPPFTGTLIHKGWRVTEFHLPKLTEKHDPKIIAPAEVEL